MRHDKNLFNRLVRALWGSKAWDSSRMRIANAPRMMRDERCGFTGVLVVGTVVSTTELLRRMRGERWCAVSFTIAGGEAPACE
jgi:hypothetical protein